MRNILYLVHRVPYPPNRGDRIRSYHLLRYLSSRARVYLATLADERVCDETRAALRDMCAEVEIVELGVARWAKAAWSLAAGRSATEGLFHSRRLHRTVDRWAREVSFDASFAFCSSMVPYLNSPALRDVPAIVDLVDVDSEKFVAYGESSSNRLKGALHALESRRLRALERSLPTRVKAVTLVSEAEADLYRRIVPNDQTLAITNGVDLEYFQPCQDEGRSGRCVFVGALDYRPNIEGINWFVREVWNSIKAAVPDATLAIVGRQPDPAVRQLAQFPGVEVIGSVPDVRPHVAGASIAVTPLRIARGVQNKVLEAMAMERPVVASSGAAEGLAVVPGQDLVVADSVEQWRDSVVRLLGDQGERRRLAAHGRSYVERHHDWNVRLAPFGRLLGCDSQRVERAEQEVNA